METPEWNMNHPNGGDLEPTGPEGQVRQQATVETPGAARGTRNQKACDGCRSRKVKCFSSPGGDRCQGCVFLDIPCTQHLPRRKRGPPNRTQIRAAAGRLQGPPAISPPSDTTQGASFDLGPDHHQRQLSCHGPAPLSHVDGRGLSPTIPPPSLLNAFAPRATITRVLDAWFNEVHALAPVLCRRHFLRRIAAGEADRDPVFCGLVVSVCAATVATLRRESLGHVTIQTCLDFIEQHRLLQMSLSRQTYTLDWCIAMYNLGTAMMALPQSEEVKMSSFNAMSQAAAGTRYLIYYLMCKLGKMEQELLKRLFWLIFVGSVSSDCQGILASSFITHQENHQQLQPEMLTDAELDVDTSTPVPMLTPEAAGSPSSERSYSSSTFSNWDNICYVAGLDSLRRLYCVWHESQTVPPAMLGGPGPALQHYQERIQQVVDGLPRELRWRGGLSRPSYVTQGHESQTVNIFISSLHLRSNLLQKRAEHNPVTAAEHQRIIDDLLEILYHLPPPVFYANGLSLMPKIRDIGAAYLEEMETCSERTPEVQDRMERLSGKLSDLDCWPEVPQIPGLIRESSCSSVQA